MKNLIPQFKSQDELFSYLRGNKSKLIAQKRALPTTSDNLEFGYSTVHNAKKFSTTKAAKEVANEVEGELQVDVIGNLAGWCDSQMDVMIKDSWNKSINDLGASGQKLFYHLKDHNYCLDAIVGKNASLYTKDIDLSAFNISTDLKKAQALVMSSTVCEDYDSKVYNLYEDGQIKQHSIGLQYINILLCLNSKNEEDATEKKNWDKYYPQVINKDKVDNAGYFWAVTEAKILEVSAVLWGANELTPVLSTSQPSQDTEPQPQKSTVPGEEEQVENKSKVICPNCKETYSSEGDVTNCPGCGQFVSPHSNRVETFDLIAAINQTQFI